ncbi:hypothetical protein FB45DRAFT_892298 [Roridomyces roridus]|uniref:Uncharacterized protein n=1 Tax=Roridomyces roridus TaxID=1738132 RepID=A0AAD7CH14_9AGAR|nr:hypothetical protein FB45DRAFT_892298 [Roridomyces roridus]
MATLDIIDLGPPHAPNERAIQAFIKVEHEIKAAILASRHDWDKHEPKMWSLASQTSDHDLVNFTIHEDLVVVRVAETSYGPMIFGKIRIRAIQLDSNGDLVPGEPVKDAHGKIQVETKHGKIDDDRYGFIFVRIHDPPGEGVENVKFHSLFTDEGKNKEGENNDFYRAIQPNSKPLEFFNE